VNCVWNWSTRRQTDRRMDRQTDREMDGRTDGQADRHTHHDTPLVVEPRDQGVGELSLELVEATTDRQTDITILRSPVKRLSVELVDATTRIARRRKVRVQHCTQGEVMSQSLRARYDRHFVARTRYNASRSKIDRVIQIKLNQSV